MPARGLRIATVSLVNTGPGPLLVRAWRHQTGGDRHGVYDETLRQVSARARSEGSLGKVEIGALVLWKRITAQARWATDLLLLPDDVVRVATGEAYSLANDVTVDLPEAGQAARLALRPLPGMGGTAALASAVLLALAPERMAVWDRRVGESLGALGCRPKSGDGFYGRYLQTLVDLAGEMTAASPDEGPFVPRDVDLALYCLAGSDASLTGARGLNWVKDSM